MKNIEPLTSLSRGLKLLLKLRESARPMGLSEISRGLGFNKGTTYRLLSTLELFKFVEKNSENRTYRIGINAFHVGSGYDKLANREKVRGIIKNLVHETKQTSALGVLDGDSVLYTEMLDGLGKVKATIEVGSRVPAHASASGKVILSGLSDSELRKRFKVKKFERITPKTITSVDRWIADLAVVRRRGFALNEEESTKGLCALAVPVCNSRGEHEAALSIAFPAGLLNQREKCRLAKKLRLAARDIESLSNIRSEMN